jgi:hypothetical protein
MTVSVLPNGTALSRYLIAKGIIDIPSYQASYATEHWRDSPAVALVLKAQQNPATSANSAPLRQYGIVTELLTLLSNVSVVERLKSRFLNVPFLAQVPIENVLLSSNWVGETQSIPISAGSLSSVTLDVTKHALIFVITKELLKVANSENAVRQIAVNSVAYGLDSTFLDATIVSTPTVRPASITNNCSVVSSTGSSAAQIQTDIANMTAALGTWRDVVFVMRQRTLSYIAATAPTLLDFSQVTPRLLGIPAFVSIGSPAQITLIDCGDILIADDPNETEIEASDQASLVMTDTPESSPAATSLVSMFQRNYTAFKVTRMISWQRAHSSSVVRMSVSY